MSRLPSPGLPAVDLPASGPWLWAAEAGVAGLGLALAVSCTRLFTGSRPIAILVAVAIIGWALALLMRRTPLRPVVGEVIYLLIGSWAGLAATARASFWFGLPTLASLQRTADAVRADFAGFSNQVAPVSAGTGHLLVLGALIWVLALFASNATMRLRSPLQGALPHTIAILALGLLARDQARTATTVVLLVTLGLYALTQAAWRNAAMHWQPAGRSAVSRAFGAGTALLTVSGLLVALLSPFSPAGTEPVLDFRHSAGAQGPRTVVSPFVEVGSNLGRRGDDVLFTVTSPVAGYWRLTSLDQYDTKTGVWVLSNSYHSVDGQLADPADRSTYQAEVKVRNLGGIWVPIPRNPTAVDSTMALNWDPSSSSLITREVELSPGDGFQLTATRTDTDAAKLAGLKAATKVDPVLLDDSGAPHELVDRAKTLGAGLPPFEQARALQNWFRGEFSYNDTVDFSDSADPVQDFLTTRAGFCQQFATAFALAARSLGLPTRVAVGFTPGEPAGEGGRRTTYTVRGRYAHAWPEVLLQGAGWVPFDPTPGRGDPSTTSITGVAAAQAAPPTGVRPSVPSSAAVTPPPTQPPATGPPTTLPTTRPAERRSPKVPTEGTGSGSDDRGAPTLSLMIILGVLVLGVAGSLWWFRRGRHGVSGERTSGDPVAAAWRRSLADLERLDVVPTRNETPKEFASRVNSVLAVPTLFILAALESERRWAPVAPSGTAAVAAAEAEERLRTDLVGAPG